MLKVLVVFLQVILTSTTYGRGNETIKSYRDAKLYLSQIYGVTESYSDTLSRKTLYCGCKFDGKLVDQYSCGFESRTNSERSKRIEWEHVVPAAKFGQNFSAWKEKYLYPECKGLSGRECAEVVDEDYRLMESDLYNLFRGD